MAFKITTTGTLTPVVFNDLAGRSFTHPIVDFDLETEFDSIEIGESADVQTAIDSGHITVKNENDEVVTDTSSSVTSSHTHNVFTDPLDGFVPAPVTQAGKFLKDDSTWDTPAAGGIFGTQITAAEDNSEQITTSDVYAQALRLTTASLPAGDYYIEWYCEQASVSSTESVVRVQVDDTDTVSEIAIRSQSSTVFEPDSGWARRTLTAAVHDIDLDFRSGGAGKTSSVRRVRIRIYRVS